MNTVLLLCVFAPFAFAAAVYVLKKRESSAAVPVLICACALELAGCVSLLFSQASVQAVDFCSGGLSLASGGFGNLFAALGSLVFLLSALSSPSYFSNEPRTARYYAFLLVTLGALIGLFFSKDLFTAYVFFEVMSVSSWVWVAQNETTASRRAADTYLAIAIIGGLAMLWGIMYLSHEFSTTDFSALRSLIASKDATDGVFAAVVCIALGFGAKAGMYPLHVWLPKAHPVAPAPASALLSGILTKAGIFGLLVCSAFLLGGNESFAALLLVLGAITMVLGALLALVSNDLKRALACSSLSQIGFIIVAVSILAYSREPSLAAGGAMLHAVNHALIKLVLFVSAGVLYKNYHTLDLNELKGSGRSSKLLCGCFLAAALSIGGVPLMSGYVSKTLIHEAIVENAAGSGLMPSLLSVTEYLFLFTGGLTLAYMAKLFVKLFVEKSDSPRKPLNIDRKTSLALCTAALPLLALGLAPNALFEKLAAYCAASLGCEPFTVSYFSLENLKGAGISLLVGAAVYLLVVRKLLTKNGEYRPLRTVFELDEGFYRPLLRALAFVCALIARAVYVLPELLLRAIRRLTFARRPERLEPPEDEHFAQYSRKYVRADPLAQTLSYELLLFGAGVVITLVYLLAA